MHLGLTWPDLKEGAALTASTHAILCLCSVSIHGANCLQRSVSMHGMLVLHQVHMTSKSCCRWVQSVMANGFKTPIGSLAIAGLMGLPLHLWACR